MIEDFLACELFLSFHSLKAYESPERTNDGMKKGAIPILL